MKNFKILILLAILACCLLGCSYDRFLFNEYRAIETYSTQYRDNIEYTKYYFYSWDYESIEATASKKGYKAVENSNLDILYAYFEDYEFWMKNQVFSSKYDFDYLSQVKEGDYFVIKTDYKGDDAYESYDIYYLDTQNYILYFFHHN